MNPWVEGWVGGWMSTRLPLSSSAEVLWQHHTGNETAAGTSRHQLAAAAASHSVTRQQRTDELLQMRVRPASCASQGAIKTAMPRSCTAMQAQMRERAVPMLQ